MEVIQAKDKKKKTEEKEWSLWELWDTIKVLMGVPQEDKEKGAVRTFEEIVTDNVQNLMREINIKI